MIKLALQAKNSICIKFDFKQWFTSSIRVLTLASRGRAIGGETILVGGCFGSHLSTQMSIESLFPIL